MIALLALFFQFLPPTATPAPPTVSPIVMPTNVGVVVTGGTPTRQQIENRTYLGETHMTFFDGATTTDILSLIGLIFFTVAIALWFVLSLVNQVAKLTGNRAWIDTSDTIRKQSYKTYEALPLGDDEWVERELRRRLAIAKQTTDPKDDARLEFILEKINKLQADMDAYKLSQQPTTALKGDIESPLG